MNLVKSDFKRFNAFKTVYYKNYSNTSITKCPDHTWYLIVVVIVSVKEGVIAGVLSLAVSECRMKLSTGLLSPPGPKYNGRLRKVLMFLFPTTHYYSNSLFPEL